MNSITPLLALKRMRELTSAGVCFSFSYMSYSIKYKRSSGIKYVNKALLRKSLRKDQSKLHDTLIAYKDIDTNKDRQFNIALLLTFNEYTIKP